MDSNQAKTRLSHFQIYRLFWKTVDLLYPPQCAGCDNPGELFCHECIEKTQFISQSHICPICGYPTPSAEICENCKTTPPPFTAMRSWAEFEGPLRKALHKLKYQSDLGLGNEFSAPLLQIIQKEGWNFDYVVPIPISKAHQRERGYNQAAILAKPLSLATGKPMLENAVRRIKETQSQVNLSREERFKNLHSAFLGNSATLINKKVLLVDDITTTGATLISCSQTLREFGCTQIFCITVARTIKQNQ